MLRIVYGGTDEPVKFHRATTHKVKVSGTTVAMSMGRKSALEGVMLGLALAGVSSLEFVTETVIFGVAATDEVHIDGIDVVGAVPERAKPRKKEVLRDTI